jgi:hypothetical protein
LAGSDRDWFVVVELVIISVSNNNNWRDRVMELLKSVVVGIVLGLGVYLALSSLGNSDAFFFGLAVMFSAAGARMFSPNKRIMLGLKSLHIIDWFAVMTISSIAFFAANNEIIAVRIIRFVCFVTFYLAIAISIRCPIVLFRKKTQGGGP